MQFTKRELQDVLFSPILWAGLGGTSILLGMIGPFGTYDQLPLAARLAYWTAIVVATYIGGLAVVHFVSHLLYGENRGDVIGYALAGALAGIPVAAIVAAINRLVFAELSGFGFLTALPYTVAAGALVSALVAFFSQRLSAPAAAAPAGHPPPRPRLLDRLPTEKRGRITRLSMQDHYVEVHTDRGSALILMRMTDAIAEAEGIDGLRIHRSHWVARDAVEQVERRGGRLVLRLRCGAELPVSRSHYDAVRSAGFR